MLSPTSALRDAAKPYLPIFKSHKVIGMHVRVGFLFREGGADSGKDTHVIQPTNPADIDPASGSVWKELDEWIEEGNDNNPSYRGRIFNQLLHNSFGCMEELGKRQGDLLKHTQTVPSYSETDTLPVKYFLATDTAAIMDQAKLLYGDEVEGASGQLISTPDEPKHPSLADKTEQLKILLDWYLLGLCDQVVAVGDSQSTFSATAWYYAGRPEMFHVQSDWGLCRRGGGGFYRMHGGEKGVGKGPGNFEPTDPHLQQCFKQESVVKRFIPTNEEKLITFFEENGKTKTPDQVRAILGKKSLPEIRNDLEAEFGSAPHVFSDDELSIDAVGNERIEVEGPESQQ
jgi:hypothetical protein